MSNIFITSSGTEIGKTFITTTLLSELKKLEYNTNALKPVATGFDEKDILKSDSALLLQAMGLKVNIENIKKITPWRYKKPLSPNITSKLENKPIVFDELVKFSQSQKNVDITLIEGIGGVMVPINNEHTVIDWIKAIEVPVILVVGSYLGSLSHSLTAIKCLISKKIKIIGIIINESENQPMSQEETANTIETFTQSIPIIIFPKVKKGVKTPSLLPLIKKYL